jgi:hypothetical protein
VPAPEAPAEPDIGEPETTHGSPASKTDAAAPPESKALEWEKNIVRVSVFDDTRSIALPVEGKEAMSGAGDSKLPKVVSPYPPKPLSPVPEGWQLRTDTSVPVRVHRVKFKDGRTLDIGVFPPALMPANPDATTVVLPQSAGNLSGAIRSARQDQAASRAKLEALLEAISLQLPASAAEAPPVP